MRSVAGNRKPSQHCRLERAAARGIIAPRRTSSAHLHRPWRATLRPEHDLPRMRVRFCAARPPHGGQTSRSACGEQQRRIVRPGRHRISLAAKCHDAFGERHGEGVAGEQHRRCIDQSDRSRRMPVGGRPMDNRNCRTGADAVSLVDTWTLTAVSFNDTHCL